MLENLAVVFEILMVVCFGFSWPFNIIKSYRARTAKGTSLYFTLLIAIGYVGGILSKFSSLSKEDRPTGHSSRCLRSCFILSTSSWFPRALRFISEIKNSIN